MSAGQGDDGTAGPAPRTPPELAAFARHYTQLAEQLFGRLGLAVRVVEPGAARNAALGTTEHATETIVLNAQLLEDILGDAADPGGALEKASIMEGVLRREVGRLKHSTPYAAGSGALGLTSAVAVLEEIRMEAQIVREHPDDARWIRAAASATTLSSLDLAAFNASFRTLSAATLTLGRIHAGTLLGRDVADLVELFRFALGEEVFQALDDLFAEVVLIPDGDVDALVGCARRLLDLVGQTDGMEVSLATAVQEEADNVLRESAAAAQERLRQDEQLAKSVEQLQRDAARGVEAEEGDEHAEVHSAAPELGRIGTVTSRPPTEPELIERNRMVRVFRAARFRERELLEELHDLPPGRLRVSGLVQRDAALANGALASVAPVFERRRHRNVDEPLLSVGLAVDTSGSMSGKERLLGVTLYTLASAVNVAGGTVAIAAFGDAPIRVTGPGAPLRGVPRLLAQGGTAFVAEAVDYVTNAAGLDRPRHVRQLYVLSDGEWQDAEEVERRFRTLRSLGCSVVVVDFGTLTNTAGANVHVMVRDVRQLGDVLFEMFEESYRNAG